MFQNMQKHFNSCVLFYFLKGLYSFIGMCIVGHIRKSSYNFKKSLKHILLLHAFWFIFINGGISDWISCLIKMETFLKFLIFKTASKPIHFGDIQKALCILYIVNCLGWPESGPNQRLGYKSEHDGRSAVRSINGISNWPIMPFNCKDFSWKISWTAHLPTAWLHSCDVSSL